MEYRIFGNPEARITLIQPADRAEEQSMEKEAGLIRAQTGADFRLIALPVSDWNRELSPWKAPAVFGREDFGDGAAETLERALALCGEPDRVCYLGGYSLAGLFALWAAGRTGRFRGIAAVSPSVWFPGFTEDLSAREIRAERVYLSLGDREEKTRNPVMARVGEKIRETHRLLEEKGVPVRLEWNEGNHFQDPEGRTAKGFAWLLNQQKD